MSQALPFPLKQAVPSLLHFNDNGPACVGTLKTVSDGAGNDTALQLSPAAGKINGDFTVTGTLTATVGTATALANTRTIGGSNFDGTANVTSFPAPGAIGGGTPSTGAFTSVTVSGAISAGRHLVINPPSATLSSLAINTTAAFLEGSTRYVLSADLTHLSQVRLQWRISSTAAASGSKAYLRYSTTRDDTAANYLDIGTSEVSIDLSQTTGVVYDTAWINLAAGAKADVFIAIVLLKASGSSTFSTSTIVAEFR